MVSSPPTKILEEEPFGVTTLLEMAKILIAMDMELTLLELLDPILTELLKQSL